MTTSLVASNWTENGLILSLTHQRSPMNYAPVALEVSGSTGIRGLLLEYLFTNCGSGSWCDAAFFQLKENISRDNFSGYWTVFDLAPGEEIENISPPTIAEKLSQIRNAFGLSMSVLAEILTVSRASVYNWFEDEPQSADIVERIETLYRIAKEWETKNPYHYPPGKLMKQKLGNRPSMFERLSRRKLNLDEIHDGINSLLMLMDKQRERMDRAKARSAKAPSDADDHSDLLELHTGSVTADK